MPKITWLVKGSIEATCTHCGGTMYVAPKKIGKSVVCKHCGKTFTATK